MYDAAVPPRIADATVPLPAAMAALVEEAVAEIARFDGEMGMDIAPFAAVLLRTESAASSKIENLTASAKAIAVAELGHHGSGNARQVVANVRTMTAALGLADQIDASTILEMHAALLGAERPEIAGKWRDEQVWIGGGDYGPHGATFVPPHQGRVGAAIADLVAFISRDDIPVLAHAAIAHAHFETIHPFPDGNGRTGRALLHAHLRHTGLTRNVTVPVSAGLLMDSEAYFTALTAYRSGDPAPIVERLAHASFAAVGNGRQLVSELRKIRHGWESRIRARRGAAAWRIVDLLLRHPVVNRQLVASELGIAGSNVYRSLEPLVAAGVLVEFTDRRRDQMWRAPEILSALDDFATRAGRRTRAAR
ncbi:MAG TPA: Fic family protein [Acidimicrobiales bacterium]|nr:Fic family protein [Acidimicrobiales bacterium]